MKGILITLGAVSAIAAAASALAFIGLPYRPLGVEFLQNNPYAPHAISAQAEGSETPTQIPNPNLDDMVINGDFRILPGAGFIAVLGDGVNEVTVWELNFSSDPQFDDFPTTASLESALLTITLTPRSPMFAGDFIRVGGLAMVNPAIYGELPQDTPSTIQLELLDFYTSDEILQALTAEDGITRMSAGSNAIVSSAQLELAAQGSFSNLSASGTNLSGRVLAQSESTGDFSGTTVALLGDGEPRSVRSVTTSRDGSFSVAVMPGNYNLVAAREGWQPHRDEIAIASGGLSLEPIHLSPVGANISTDDRPGAQNAPAVVDATVRGNQDNGLVFYLNVDIDRPARAWAIYHPQGDEANALTTPMTQGLGTNQELLLARLQPDTAYDFQVLATEDEVAGPDEATLVSEPFSGSFTTASLPAGLTDASFSLLAGRKTYGLTLLDFNNDVFQGMLAIDASGEVVWYHQHDRPVFPIGQDDNLNLVFGELGGDRMVEITPDGTLVREVGDLQDDGSPCSPSGRWHHEIMFQPDNMIYTLGSEIREVSIDGELRRITGDTIVVWDRNQEIVETRASLFDLLDPQADRTPASGVMGGFFWRGCDVSWQLSDVEGAAVGVEDWTHANSLWSGAEGNIIMSLRHLDQVISIDPDLESVQWRLGGPNSDFQFPDPTDHFYHQHTAQELPNGNILLFDNGNHRPAEEGGEYSRALELELDFETMEARKVWEYRHSPDLFAQCCSSAQRLDNGNTVLVFGADHATDACCRNFTLVEADAAGMPVSIMEIALPDLSIVYRVYPLDSIGGESPAG